MISNTLVEKLQKIVCSESIYLALDKIALYAADETHGLSAHNPDLVVVPKNVAELSKILAMCNAKGVHVTARGGGTGKSGGCVPQLGGVVISFERFNQIIEIDEKNGVAVVEPGVILGDFQQAVKEKGFFYPPDPASLSSCTLGGNIAENASGPSTMKYGSTKDYVLGLEAVLASGQIINAGKRTLKGVSGFDITSLLCGSEGTLALVTKITLRLLPLPKYVKTALLGFENGEDAARAIAYFRQHGVMLRCAEYIDEGSIKALRQNGEEFPLVGVNAILIIECDGFSEAAVEEELCGASRLAKECGCIKTVVAQDARQQRDIWNLRHKLSVATKRFKKHKVSEDIVVPCSKIPEMVTFVRELGMKHGFDTCAFGHAGDGNLHVQIMFQNEKMRANIDALLEELFKKTIEFGGTLTGEHGIGLAKKKYLALEQSAELIALQKRIKMAFDPKGILNAGKIFD